MTSQGLVGRCFGLLEPLVNPLVRGLVVRGLPPGAFAVLETTGRRTGLRRRVPVGNGLRAPDGFWLVAEHGEGCAYVANLRANPQVRVCTGGRWHRGTASLHPGDDPLRRRASIDASNGLIGRLDGIIFRATATTPLSIHIDLEPEVIEPSASCE